MSWLIRFVERDAVSFDYADLDLDARRRWRIRSVLFFGGRFGFDYSVEPI